LKATSSPTVRAAVDHQLGAEIQDAGHRQLVEHLDEIAGRVAETDHLERGADIAGELLLPAPLHLRLDRHRLQRLDASHALDQKRLVLGPAIEFLLQPFAEQRRRAHRDQQIERYRAEHDPGQQRRVEVHHHDEDQGEEQIDHQGQCRAGQERPDVLELAHASH
jgi:hypothetical protein